MKPSVKPNRSFELLSLTSF